jgi:regulator of sirC expression with transglutaminase-like and TPR domain
MARLEDLPHLLQLLDDESPEIRSHVWEVLASFGAELEKSLAPLLPTLPRSQQVQLLQYVEDRRWKQFQENWWSWLEIEEDWDAIEYAVNGLAELDKPLGGGELAWLVDQLAEAYLAACKEDPSVVSLMQFLFHPDRLRPPKSRNRHPLRSNLIAVLETGEGVYLSLTLAAVLVSRRLGLEMGAYLFQNHYLLIGEDERGPNIFDPYRGGKAISPYQLESEQYPLRLTGMSLWTQQAHPTELMLRLLNNTIRAYQSVENPEMVKRYQAVKDQLIALLSKDQEF